MSLWARTVVFVSPEDLPPKVYSEGGELKGTYVEIIREICKRLNIEPEFQFYPWARAVAQVKSGKADAIFPPLKNSERAEFLYFPQEPMSITRNVIFAPKKRHVPAKSMEELKGLIVGVNDQYSYGEKFDAYKTQLQLDSSLNEKELIQKLAHASLRRIDVAAASEEAFRFMITREKLQDDFEELFTISESTSYVAFSKAKGTEAKELSESFSRTFRQLKQEGIVQKILAKYSK